MSFRNIQRQKSYRNVLGDRSELWPSIDSLLFSFLFSCTREEAASAFVFNVPLNTKTIGHSSKSYMGLLSF